MDNISKYMVLYGSGGILCQYFILQVTFHPVMLLKDHVLHQHVRGHLSFCALLPEYLDKVSRVEIALKYSGNNKQDSARNFILVNNIKSRVSRLCFGPN